MQDALLQFTTVAKGNDSTDINILNNVCHNTIFNIKVDINMIFKRGK